MTTADVEQREERERPRRRAERAGHVDRPPADAVGQLQFEGAIGFDGFQFEVGDDIADFEPHRPAAGGAGLEHFLHLEAALGQCAGNPACTNEMTDPQKMLHVKEHPRRLHLDCRH